MLQCDFDGQKAPSSQRCVFALTSLRKTPGLGGDIPVRDLARLGQRGRASRRSCKRNNELQLRRESGGFIRRDGFSLMARHFMTRRDMRPASNYWQNGSCLCARSRYTPKKF